MIIQPVLTNAVWLVQQRLHALKQPPSNLLQVDEIADSPFLVADRLAGSGAQRQKESHQIRRESMGEVLRQDFIRQLGQTGEFSVIEKYPLFDGNWAGHADAFVNLTRGFPILLNVHFVTDHQLENMDRPFIAHTARLWMLDWLYSKISGAYCYSRLVYISPNFMAEFEIANAITQVGVAYVGAKICPENRLTISGDVRVHPDGMRQILEAVRDEKTRDMTLDILPKHSRQGNNYPTAVFEYCAKRYGISEEDEIPF